MNNRETPPRRLYHVPDVLAMLGVSRSTLQRWIDAGDFPRPTRLGPARIAWKVEDVEEWLASRPAA